jgi:hypothetical protein
MSTVPNKLEKRHVAEMEQAKPVGMRARVLKIEGVELSKPEALPDFSLRVELGEMGTGPYLIIEGPQVKILLEVGQSGFEPYDGPKDPGRIYPTGSWICRHTRDDVRQLDEIIEQMTSWRDEVLEIATRCSPLE